jgi:colanic acid biosynthesis glycosyl transferase WcaI
VLHQGSFAASSLPTMLGQISWWPDVVFAVEPSLFCAPSALLEAKLCDAGTWWIYWILRWMQRQL